MKRHSPLAYAIFPILFVMLLLPSCSEDPTSVPNPPPLMSGTGDVDPNGDREFLLGSVVIDPANDGRIDVLARGLTVDGTGASFDVVLHNRSRTDAYAPLHFRITRVVPNDVTVTNADFTDRGGVEVFDFSDDIGDDNVLSAGELSAPVEVMFAWPEPTAFSVAFEITVGEPTTVGTIGGVVFNDLDLDGIRASNEPGLPGILVELRSTPQDSTGPLDFLLKTRTDANGEYGFHNLRAGLYKITVIPSALMQPTTPTTLLVTLVTLPDGTVGSFFDADFGIAVEEPSPPHPPPEWIFGPVGVGPSHPNGTELDTTFIAPPHPTNIPYKYVLEVLPPLITAGVYPLRIDTATVVINGHTVFHFVCEEDDSTVIREQPCVPFARIGIEPGVVQIGENSISMRVVSVEHSMLFFTVFREEDDSHENGN